MEGIGCQFQVMVPLSGGIDMVIDGRPLSTSPGEAVFVRPARSMRFVASPSRCLVVDLPDGVLDEWFHRHRTAAPPNRQNRANPAHKRADPSPPAASRCAASGSSYRCRRAAAPVARAPGRRPARPRCARPARQCRTGCEHAGRRQALAAPLLASWVPVPVGRDRPRWPDQRGWDCRDSCLVYTRQPGCGGQGDRTRRSK